MRSGVVLLAALSLACALAAPAQAVSLQQRDAETEWQIANDCTRKAFKAFPDYTPAGNAQREYLLKSSMIWSVQRAAAIA